MAKPRHLLIYAAILLLAGCKSYIIGYSENASMFTYGEGDIQGDVATFSLGFAGIELNCDGRAEVTYKAPGIIGSKSRLTMTCSDGRTAKGGTLVTSLEGGTGFGVDSCGNKFDYVWTINQEFSEEKVKEFKAKVKESGNNWIDKCKV